jgi:hypothetical protein
MVKHMTSSKLFITGCDRNTRWMEKWFVQNFSSHNPGSKIHVYDFDSSFTNSVGWFKKPDAMLDAAKKADSVCWLDIDCEVLGHLGNIWEYLEPNKLGMVEDKPWSSRQGTTWHNSGVVAFNGTPDILKTWKGGCVRTNERGDQEVLHKLLADPLTRLSNITTLPNRYNVLRLQHIDKTLPKSPLIHHWTGNKGKEHIRNLTND